MSGTRVCAFCDQPAPLTREHIWPRCIIERTPSYSARYLGKTEKFFEGELTVKDVCATCNNGVLSSLDDYICSLYDRQLSRIALRRQPRTVLLDYPLLSRWLLKASYNSARANLSDVAVLKQYAPYILAGTPDPEGFEVRLELVAPSKNPKYVPGSSIMQEIPPHSVRCCRIEIPHNPVPDTIVRLVAVNSFYFWLVFWSSGTDASPLLELLPGKSIAPNMDRLTLSPKRGTLELHADWVRNPNASRSMKSFRMRNVDSQETPLK